MIGTLPFRLHRNARAGAPRTAVLTEDGFRRARAAITAWPDYRPTPLHDLPSLARAGRVGQVRLKDESSRFGQGSFKALGGAYAVGEALQAERARTGRAAADVTVTCASEGNHGRAVAWGARRLMCRSVVFLHGGVSAARAAAIAAEGAAIVRAGATYDDAVRACATAARYHGWTIVSDTSWPGYCEIPRAVMQGYRLMADEALAQWTGPLPSHVFVQGGVGGMAAAVAAHLAARLAPPPRVIVVEPDCAACLLASALRGAPEAVAGPLDTIMAGLACGTPSLLAFPILERAAAAFMAIPDAAIPPALGLLAELGLTIGPSGVAGLAGFALAASDPRARSDLAIGPSSRVLLFATEGADNQGLIAQQGLQIAANTPAGR